MIAVELNANTTQEEHPRYGWMPAEPLRWVSWRGKLRILFGCKLGLHRWKLVVWSSSTPLKLSMLCRCRDCLAVGEPNILYPKQP